MGMDAVWLRPALPRGPCLADQPVAGPRDGRVPAELGALAGEFCRAADDLDEPVAGSVAQPPLHDLVGSRHIRLLVRGCGLVVDKQHAAVAGQRATQQRPELAEHRGGHVREPEGQEDGIERPRRAGRWSACGGDAQWLPGVAILRRCETGCGRACRLRFGWSWRLRSRYSFTAPLCIWVSSRQGAGIPTAGCRVGWRAISLR